MCGDGDETINHISECSKLIQKEHKTWHDCVGKVIHWELCKKLMFEHTNKWYIHNPASILANETQKLLWDFNIQTDHPISVTSPDLIIINKGKRTCRIADFAVPAEHRVKLKEIEKKDMYLDLARELKKTVEHKSDDYTNCNWCSWFSHQRIETRTGGLGKTGRMETIQTTALLSSARILRIVLETWGKLAVTQIPAESHQLTLVWKTLKWAK